MSPITVGTRISLTITGTRLEELLRRAKKEQGSERTRLFQETSAALTKELGGKAPTKEFRGTPDIINLPASSPLNVLLTQKLRQEAVSEVEIKSSISTERGPEILSSEISKSVSAIQGLLETNVLKPSDLKKDEIKRFLTPTGRISKAEAKKSPEEFIQRLNADGLRKLITADTSLWSDIKRKTKNLAILVVGDSEHKGGKPSYLHFFKDTEFEINDFQPFIFEAKSKAQQTSGDRKVSYAIAVPLKSNVFNALIGRKSQRTLKILQKATNKHVRKLDFSQLLSFGMGLREGGNTPLSYAFRIPRPRFNIRGKLSTSKDIKEQSTSFQAGRYEITEAIRRSMRARMPKGPPKGPPLSETILTNRTGRFLNSIRAFVDFRRNIVEYFYMPLYQVHIPTTRNPDRSIETSIRAIVGKVVGQNLRIVRKS